MTAGEAQPSRRNHCWSSHTWVALRLIPLIIVSLILTGCRASNERFATETAGAISTPQLTPTNTPSGDLLMIDTDPVHAVFIPTVDGPARYALTADWLYRLESNEWVLTETRADNRSILVDPARPQRLFRGNHPPCSLEEEASGEIEPTTFSKSTDGGNSWRAVPGGDNILPLVIDPTLGDVIYGSDCGLAISTDAGETWRAYYRSRGHTVIDAVVVGERLLVLEVSLAGRGRLRAINVTVPEDPELDTILLETRNAFSLDASQERIVVAGTEGVELSVDNGSTWTLSRNGLEEVTVESVAELSPAEAGEQLPKFGVLSVRLDSSHPQRVFAGTVGGLFISQDSGLTWDPYLPVPLDARVLDIQFAAGGDVYVTTPSGVLIVPNP
jgi:hypothetical protein